MPPAYSPTLEFAKPMGRKPAAVTSVPVSIGKGRRPGEGGRAHAVPALLDLHHHHLDGDDGIVHEKAERDDQRAEGDAVEVDAQHAHHDEGEREHERDRQGHHDAGAPAERQDRDEQHDAERFDEGMLEFRIA